MANNPYRFTQNAEEIQALLNKVQSPDSSPTANSTNLVTSGGVKAALDQKAAKSDVDTIEGKIPSSASSSNKMATQSDLTDFITRAVTDLVNYYTKSQTYTKLEVNNLIGALHQFHFEIYETLPATGDGSVLYLIGPTGTGSDKYEEYVWANDAWTKIGDTTIDLSGYVTTEALNAALENYATAAQVSELGQKLIKLVGMGTIGGGTTGITAVGQCYYNTTQKKIYKAIAITDPLKQADFVEVPFLDGAVYTYNGELYLWDGNDLVYYASLNVVIDFNFYEKKLGWVANTGAITAVDSTSRHYSIPTLQAPKVSISAKDDEVAVITFAKSIGVNGSWQLCDGITRYVIDAGDTTIVNVPGDANYVIVGARASSLNTDDDFYTPKTMRLNEVKVPRAIEYSLELLSSEKSELNDIQSRVSMEYSSTFNSTENERVRNSGSTITYADSKVSAFKKLNGETLSVKNVIGTPNPITGTAALAFYDKDKKFINSYIVSSSGVQSVTIEPSDFPAGAVYVRGTYLPSYGDIEFISGVYPVFYDAPSIPQPQILTFNPESPQMMAAISRQPRSNGVLYTKPLILAHFSDMHLVNTVETDRIMQFCSHYADKIDDVLCTGDVLRLSNESTNYWAGGIIQSVLFCVGNHDAYANNMDQTLAAQSVVYDKFFAPNISYWNVTNHPTGKTYYYKDYATQKIRLVVLDCMYWDSSQNTWMQDALSDAITNGMRVICADHYPAAAFTPIVCNFDDSHLQALAAERYIDAAAVNNVKDFIDGGGEFICWITGHEHCDYMGTLNADSRQLMIGIDRGSNRDDLHSAVPRIINTRSQDLFNVYGFDVYNKQIRLYRVGANKDMYMRVKNSFCINYVTKDIISND